MKLAAKMALSAAILLPILATPSTAATLYTISFALSSGIAPTSGSFVYDSSTGFSAFHVLWNGTLFDLTPSADGPTLAGMVGSPCDSRGTNQQYGFIIMSKSATGCSPLYSWHGDVKAGIPEFNFQLSTATGNDRIQVSSPSDLSWTSNGTWSIAAVAPEPSTISLMLLAALSAVGKRYLKRRSQ